jgi:ABC-type Fe3+-hydroxamate transport system substrate-binding protein
MDSGGGYFREIPSNENVVTQNPDIIGLLDSTYGNYLDQWTTNPKGME